MTEFIRHRFREVAKVPYYALYRTQLRLICWWSDLFEVPNALPPTLMRFRVCESRSAAEFLSVGDGCAQHVAIQASRLGLDLGNATRVLDFGCGCGRILRWLVPRYPEAEFHGTDVDREAVEWNRTHLPTARFSVSSFEPPLIYESGMFDLIYCFSVFTHLDEVRQDLWLAELRRLLKPGGLLFLTVHGANATGLLDEESRRMIAANGFLHRRSSKFKGLLPSWYHTSWHSREYITGKLLEMFDEVDYVEIPDGMQDFVLARLGPTDGRYL